jgi:hypothetical protein
MNGAALLAIVACASRYPDLNPTNNDCVTVCASVSGGLVYGGQWYLSVNPEGTAYLSVFHGNEPGVRRFIVESKQIDRLLSLVRAVSTTHADIKLGSQAPGGCTSRIVIVFTDMTISLTISEIDGVLESEGEEAETLKRALLIEQEIESWLPPDASLILRG